MPVESEWLHDGHVMFNTYSGDLTTNDVVQVINEHTRRALESSYPIHVIADGRQITKLPPNILGLLQRDAKRLEGVEKGVFVVITRNRAIVAILNVLAKLVPGTDFRFVRTPDEAWHIVNHLLSKEKSV